MFSLMLWYPSLWDRHVFDVCKIFAGIRIDYITCNSYHICQEREVYARLGK